MSGSYKHHRYAVVIVGLLLSVALIGWLFEVGGRHESCNQIASPANYSENQQHNGQAKYAEVCSTDFQVFGDTIAQWLMALFAIAATLVSWRAVFLVRETWVETKRTAAAAIEANQISRDFSQRELRAYLSIERVRIERFEPEAPAKVELVVKNNGQTPARYFQSHAMFRLFRVGDDKYQIFKNSDNAASEKSIVEIGPGAEYTVNISSVVPIDFFAYHAIVDGVIRNEIGVYGQFYDAFGKRRLFVFRALMRFDEEANAYYQAASKNNRTS